VTGGRLSSKEHELRSVVKQRDEELRSMQRQSDQQLEHDRHQHQLTLTKVCCPLHFASIFLLFERDLLVEYRF